MNDKLKRLAIKMVDLFPSEFSSPQDCYNLFQDIYKRQFDYLSYFKPENLIKLVIYIYSYQTTKDFKLADKMLDNLAFASLFTTEGNVYLSECESCDGRAVEQCDWCDGAGETDCDECDGSGEDVEGITCLNCGGDGSLVCDNCSGDGEVNCYDCDGTGDVETNDLEIIVYYICTWDKSFQTSCELREGQLEPAMSEYEFARLRDNFITLHMFADHRELRSGLNINELYCLTYSDEFKMIKSIGDRLNILWDGHSELNKYSL